MDAVSQIIDSNLLSDIIVLPEHFLNKEVEVTVSLREEKTVLPSMTLDEIDELVKGSIIESLTGVLPHSDKSVEDYRAERLKEKYELAD